MAAETLKVALLAATSTAAAGAGEAAQGPLMALLVPLLIEAAAPAQGASSPSPQLADMALKLITHLASGPAAPAFKAAVAALPLGAKQRLQAALAGPAGAPTAAAEGPIKPAASSAKPSIALKSFASLKMPGPH